MQTAPNSKNSKQNNTFNLRTKTIDLTSYALVIINFHTNYFLFPYRAKCIHKHNDCNKHNFINVFIRKRNGKKITVLHISIVIEPITHT